MVELASCQCQFPGGQDARSTAMLSQWNGLGGTGILPVSILCWGGQLVGSALLGVRELY
ncbi:hypothetical protein [Moorena sp. SIO3H5]|uniref:hypothetical protein n=1 Tax=Moorena sp. SIO3H5 TaxID=2607834 RepID=UPI0025EA97F9|nr:hypothetical protein [Moorena sp. SIO3H5]